MATMLLILISTIFIVCFNLSFPTSQYVSYLKGVRRNLEASNEAEFSLQVQNAQHKHLYFPLVDVEHESAVFYGIEYIQHNARRRSIRIKFKPGARCPHPHLVGRLSGNSLIMIKWNEHSPDHFNDDGSTTTIGHYNVPATGKYYIEIIMINCLPVPDDFTRINVTPYCVENPLKHRLTAIGATIDTKVAKPVLPGYWRSPANIPLFTRWQPENCRYPNDHLERCTIRTNMQPFEKYQFHWTVPRNFNGRPVEYDEHDENGIMEKFIFPSCVEQGVGPQCNVCTVGASHSRRLAKFLYGMGVTGVGYFEYHFPEEVFREDIEEIAQSCRIVIMGFGQWSGASELHLSSPIAHGNEMARLLGYFKNIEKKRQHGSESGPVKVYMRSVHAIPLGDHTLLCPVKDVRTPHVFERYNEVLKRIGGEMGVEFLDTDAITRPMWDSSHDWNHLTQTLQIMESQYIADVLQLPFRSS